MQSLKLHVVFVLILCGVCLVRTSSPFTDHDHLQYQSHLIFVLLTSMNQDDSIKRPYQVSRLF